MSEVIIAEKTSVSFSPVQDLEFTNSLSNLVQSVYQNGIYNGQVQLSQTETLEINTRQYLISNNRNLLSQLYVEHGIVQTMIDQPVDDSFRSGFEIKSSHLDGNDVEELFSYLEESQAIAEAAQAIKWGRLFGGGAVLIITGQDPLTPFNIEKVTEKTPLIFRAVDMWELYEDGARVQGSLDPLDDGGEYYNYYGKKIHKSYVLKVVGKRAPSFVQPRLRGWGMSEVEKLVRSLNQYIKNQDVIFELMDEAKVDVFKIKGFTSSMLSKDGGRKVAERIQAANMLKNYQNAISMDAEDDYSQKQMAFTGLSEMLLAIRQGIAADLKMPMTKIFGISAAGFNSGEDDIENYNSMIEGEVRNKNKHTIMTIIKIACRKKFGFIPDDLKMTWNPLRILSAEQEENVKEKKFNRVTSAFNSGLIDGLTAKKSINKDALLPVEVTETDEIFVENNPDAQTDEIDETDGGTSKKGKNAPEAPEAK